MRKDLPFLLSSANIGVVVARETRTASGSHTTSFRNRYSVIGSGTMRSEAATIDDFLSEQPANVRQDLVQLRSISRSEMPEALEGMTYGGPL